LREEPPSGGAVKRAAISVALSDQPTAPIWIGIFSLSLWRTELA